MTGICAQHQYLKKYENIQCFMFSVIYLYTWAEIKNTSPMNNENLQNTETTTFITKRIKKESNVPECNGIAAWEKNCPTCNALVRYKNKKCLNKSLKKNQTCKRCAKLGTVIGPMPDSQKDRIRKTHLKLGVGRWMSGRKLDATTKLKISLHNKGKVLSNETKKKLSLSKIGEKNPAKRFDVRLKISETAKKVHRTISDATRKKLSTKSKAAMLERIEKLGVIPRPNFNPVACDYFCKLNEKLGWNLQHAKNGGERRILCYYPDAYDSTANVVVEYDEPRHYNVDGSLKTKDVRRMQEIIEHARCDFYRFNEKFSTLSMYSLCDNGEFVRTEIYF